MKLKKTILATFASLLFSYSIAAEQPAIIKEIMSDSEGCKHTAVHYATSVERYNYVKGLLDRKDFTLYELNSQCQTPMHIASELGNVSILNLFYDYLGNFEVVNSKNETPLMTAVKNNQHQAILFMVEKEANLEHQDDQGNSVRRYFKQYGDYLSQKILRNHDNKEALNNFENNFNNKDVELSKLKTLIEEKEVKILELTKDTNVDSNVVKSLQEEVTALRNSIREFEVIIAKQKQELEELRALRDLYNQNVKSNVELSPARKIEFLETHVPEDDNKLLENFKKSDESDLNKLSEELKLMDLLSKPRYKVKENK